MHTVFSLIFPLYLLSFRVFFSFLNSPWFLFGFSALSILCFIYFFTFYRSWFLFFEILMFLKHFFAVFSFVPLCFGLVGVILIFRLFHYICLCRSHLLCFTELGPPPSGCSMLLNTLCSFRSGVWGWQAVRGKAENALGFLEVWERLDLAHQPGRGAV